VTTIRYLAGNAAVDGAPFRGWLVSHFLDSSITPLRHSDDVEIKWSVHPAGESRASWVRRETRTCIVMLVSGRFRIRFSDEPGDEVVLTKEGDYVMWGPNVDHLWTAEDASVVVTVRWPSRTT